VLSIVYVTSSTGASASGVSGASGTSVAGVGVVGAGVAGTGVAGVEVLGAGGIGAGVVDSPLVAAASGNALVSRITALVRRDKIRRFPGMLVRLLRWMLIRFPSSDPKW